MNKELVARASRPPWEVTFSPETNDDGRPGLHSSSNPPVVVECGVEGDFAGFRLVEDAELAAYAVNRLHAQGMQRHELESIVADAFRIMHEAFPSECRHCGAEEGFDSHSVWCIASVAQEFLTTDCPNCRE